jgi:hypothetical protein
MLRVGCALLVLAAVAGSTVTISCSSSPPRDQNFGTEAGADFIPPPPDLGTSDAGQGGATDGGDDGADGGTDVGGDA